MGFHAQSFQKQPTSFPQLVPLVQGIVEAEKQSSMSDEHQKKIKHLKALLPGLQFGEYRKLLESADWDLMCALNNYTAIPIRNAKSPNTLRRNKKSTSNFRTDLNQLTNNMNAWSPSFVRKTFG